MNTAKKVTGAAVAAAAAALISTGFTASAVASPAQDGTVKCSGINSCKGTAACATATNACKGQNSCKGQGWIKATKQECADKGGKVVG